ncbi:MAG TPA: response regulator transcription factor [Vicinamibacterales bacterium]|jgi:two-component system alkaline phosphatase synthesis response regulator PhoP|nr:response regulator transcription factor [Vicinamibacterales bacterium]
MQAVPNTVLIVDDEPRIAEIAGDYLRHAGFGVLVAATGREGVARARADRPALVVLDLRLPDMDGIEVAHELRRSSDVPIVMLTARAEESDRLLGLDAGADDYIVKPFSPRELVARVRAVLRRTSGPGGPGSQVKDAAEEARGSHGATLRIGDVTLDTARLTVERGRERIDLTATEFQLLATLAARPGRLFTRGQLLDAIRGSDADAFDRAIDAHVKNIRRKIERDPRSPRYVLTVYGVGYKAAEE